MKLSISNRLLLCASFVPPGARVADIGTDHGYLGIHLLETGAAAHVIASDVRPKPLARAKANAAAFEVGGRMEFRLCSGLSGYLPEECDCIVCAGMGGDCIVSILNACCWVRDPRYLLILQPQSSGNDLRRFLGEAGFSIEHESLTRDGHFLYSAFTARFGGETPLTPGQQYLSPPLLESGDPLLPDYFNRVISALRRTVDGIQISRNDSALLRLPYYQTALTELLEMKQQYDNRSNRF